MGHNHLLQVVVGRGVSGCGRQDLVESVRRKRNDRTVNLSGVASIHSQGLELRIIDDESLAIKIVNRVESVNFQLLMLLIDD